MNTVPNESAHDTPLPARRRLQPWMAVTMAAAFAAGATLCVKLLATQILSDTVFHSCTTMLVRESIEASVDSEKLVQLGQQESCAHIAQLAAADYTPFWLWTIAGTGWWLLAMTAILALTTERWPAMLSVPAKVGRALLFSGGVCLLVAVLLLLSSFIKAIGYAPLP